MNITLLNAVHSSLGGFINDIGLGNAFLAAGRLLVAAVIRQGYGKLVGVQNV
jgi:hypothetical protein